MPCIRLIYLIPSNRVKLKSSLFRVKILISCQYWKVSLLYMISVKKSLITTYKIKLFLLFISDRLIPGGLPYERGGDVRRKFWIKPRKETNLGVAQHFLTPETDHFRLWLHESSKLKRFENISLFYISSRVTLKETFTAKCNGVLPRTP